MLIELSEPFEGFNFLLYFMSTCKACPVDVLITLVNFA